MYPVVISGTGLFVPPHVITNDELVEAFNAYADAGQRRARRRHRRRHAPRDADSSVEFIEKASGIKQRYVMDKAGVLDPKRMRPRFEPRADDELSLMAEIGVAAARQALARAGKTGADIDAVHLRLRPTCSAPTRRMAVEIQDALGIQGYGFDMNVACSSATFGIEQAVNAVKCGTARAVLVVNPEITSAPPRLERPRLPLHLRRRLHRDGRRARRHAPRAGALGGARHPAARRSSRTTSATTSAS